ncbi:MAG: transcriptional regulator, DeoR family [Anaerocolumna sp.]|jgi:DeoR/GlpR family transcriptional regulator of sugar metabolism|nr:transcriptional regulator, DeoR family [Anaerocolumna sp.]
MFIAERKKKIIEMIQENGNVQVEKLAEDLGVSTMTIRRDLKKLKDEGIIERCYGGAVIKQEVTYADKQINNKKSKEQIASKCAEHVKADNVVFLDAGTTTYEIARMISSIPGLLVVTNDLEIAQLLKNSDVELIVCGGTVQKTTGSMYGYYATQMMENFQFDIGFFGAASIDRNMQVLTPTIEKVFFKRLIMKNCKQLYLAVDNSKFNKKAMSKVSNLSDYTAVVTDYKFSENELDRLVKDGVKIISV